MDFQAKILLSLAVVDAVILAIFGLWLRSTPPMDEKKLSANRTVLFMFLMHALASFKGAILILQLATISILLVLCYLQHIGKISKAKVVVAKGSP